MRTSAAPDPEGIRRVENKRIGLILNVKMACSVHGDVVRTAGVHAGRGNCNRAVEVCVSGFGNPNRNRGGDNPGEWFQRVLQRLVAGRWAVACAAAGEARRTKRDVTEEYIQAIGEELKSKETPTAIYQGLDGGVRDDEGKENGMEGDSSLSVGQASRVESRQDWGSGKMGGGGVKRPAGQAKLREGGEE